MNLCYWKYKEIKSRFLKLSGHEIQVETTFSVLCCLPVKGISKYLGWSHTSEGKRAREEGREGEKLGVGNWWGQEI